MEEERSVGVVAFSPDSQLFCLVQHAAGHWGFPKGHAEAGEADEAAALRELQEETGTEAAVMTDITLQDQYQLLRDGIEVRKTVDYFLAHARQTGVTPAPGFEKEIIAVRWLPYAAARELLTHEGSKNVLDRAWNYLEEHTTK